MQVKLLYFTELSQYQPEIDCGNLRCMLLFIEETAKNFKSQKKKN